ncbi:MAG: Gfo/Idh/MocA family oxidoreductase [Candidatus Hydrogenedentes bacterium]|nr:Gfo/Idh/MocA family oxidoreductase [Candidatus Hydrogenedentota bacterium]
MDSQQKPLSRRAFLRRTGLAAAGAAAFPHIIPGSALGLDGAVAPSNRITVGSIGVGGMGTGNLKGFLGQKRAQVLAVCDVDREHRQNAAGLVNEQYGNTDCAEYNDFRELLARGDIDAVALGLPDHWHGLAGVAAARAGKDIYGEKPLAYNISEGRAVVDAVARYGGVWQTGSWQRSNENFRFGCELVRNGRIGRVRTVKVGLPATNGIREGSTQPCDPPEGFDYDMWLGPAPWAPYCPARCHWNFRWISDYAGGQLTDWAGHHIDIAHWGMGTELGAPVEIEGRGQWPRAKDGLFDTPENYTFTCKYREGFEMTVSALLPGGTRFEGEDGWVHVNRGFIDAEPKRLLKERIGPDEIHLIKSDNHIGNFLDCVASRAKTITPAEAAHHSVMVAHLGMAAMRLERTLRFDPEREIFPGDDEANRTLSRAMRAPWHL